MSDKPPRKRPFQSPSSYMRDERKPREEQYRVRVKLDGIPVLHGKNMRLSDVLRRLAADLVIEATLADTAGTPAVLAAGEHLDYEFYLR